MGKHVIEVPFVGKAASDLLLWRDVKKTGAIFGAATAAFVYFQWSPVSPAVHVFQIVALATIATFALGQALAVMGRPGVPVPEMLKTGVSEENVKKVAELVHGPINRALATVSILLGGKDMKLSLMVFGSAYLASVVFARIPLLILCYTVFLVAFGAPKGYEMKKDEADKALAMAKAKVDELKCKFQESVMSKIPKAKKQ